MPSKPSNPTIQFKAPPKILKMLEFIREEQAFTTNSSILLELVRERYSKVKQLAEESKVPTASQSPLTDEIG